MPEMRTLSNGATIRDGCLNCACGEKYHVSLFYDVLRAIAARALKLGRMTDDQIVDDAIAHGYWEAKSAASADAGEAAHE